MAREGLQAITFRPGNLKKRQIYPHVASSRLRNLPQHGTFRSIIDLAPDTIRRLAIKRKIYKPPSPKTTKRDRIESTICTIILLRSDYAGNTPSMRLLAYNHARVTPMEPMELS
ncbi:hypothetical protein COCVIDRAFT_15364 [Bipolaris victoriae FI3]|uniref:Uncharacterized protein n=1 Tax=Bipolaris victoriae (strain FI3) TaxID=930091 RepID=W7EBL5_BIPV3|nr:hypothetical protein COCVIDRAFT_15364 [Bipolaris victoriae FI3]